MKKLLLSLCTAVLALSASAAEYTIEFVKGETTSPKDFELTTPIDSIVSVGADYISEVLSTSLCGAGQYGLKIGQNKKSGEIKLALADKGKVVPSTITIVGSNNKGTKCPAFKFNGTEYSFPTKNTTYTTVTIDNYEGTLEYLDFERPQDSPEGYINIKSITVTYDAGDVPAPTIAAPVITLIDGEWGPAVEMTCSDADAEIYYTTDGTEPNAEDGFLYDEPVDIWFNTTFKAIAIKGEEVSEIVTYEAKPTLELEEFSFLLEMEADMLNGPQAVVINSDMRAVYQNGNYTFVRAAENNMLVYGKNQPKLNNGDTFSTLSGEFIIFDGQPEFQNATYGDITHATAESKVAPFNLDIDMVALNMLYQYVRLTNVEITDDGKTITGTANGETCNVAIFDRFGVKPADGKGFTITGFISKYNDNLQFWPTEITGGAVMEQVATPVFTPAAGELEAGATISITCETEGAAIHYTTDGSEPTATSTLYTAPIAFTTAMTVKAIAVAEGMLDSEVASASYTLHDPNAPISAEATFNFADPESMGVTIPDDTSKGIDITTLESGVVTLTSTNEASTANRLWLSNGAWELRTYAANSIEISVPETYQLVSIESDPATAFASATWSNGSFSENKWNPAEEVTSVSFTGVKATKVKSLKVTYKGTSGVADAAVDADAVVEYFNLQGVRVQGELTPGLYIRRQGNNTSKVVIR